MPTPGPSRKREGSRPRLALTLGAAAIYLALYNKYILLSSYQKQSPLSKTIGEYEDRIKRSANFPVTQYQFDALVSLGYDSGAHLSHVTRAIAAGKLADVEKDWLSRTYERKHYSKGLTNRTEREVKLFNNGVYK